MDGRAHVHRCIRLPDQLQDAHGNVAALYIFCRGAQFQTVRQQHIEDQAEGHAREHGQAELIIALGVAPPQQRRHPGQQQKPAAIRKDEPLVEGDPVVDPAVDDVFGICDGKVQPEKPDEVHHPVQLKPQMRAALGPQLLAIHGISPIISMC